MNLTKIRYITDDVKSAINFYKDYLDFHVQLHAAPGFAILVKDNFQLLLTQPGSGGAGQAMPDGSLPIPGGWNRLQLTVNDLPALYSNLKARGAIFRSEIIDGKVGKQVLLEDPSGNLIELFEPKQKNSSTSKNNSYKPEGYHNITPYLAIRNADDLAEFIKTVFGADEHRLMRREDGSFMHGEFRIGDSLIMIGDVQQRYDPFPGMLYLYVSDTDEIYKKAINEGATSLEEPADQEYGDRRAAFTDPAGNKWYVATCLNPG